LSGTEPRHAFHFRENNDIHKFFGVFLEFLEALLLYRSCMKAAQEIGERDASHERWKVRMTPLLLGVRHMLMSFVKVLTWLLKKYFAKSRTSLSDAKRTSGLP
jgi:uncharacterized membrane protein